MLRSILMPIVFVFAISGSAPGQTPAIQDRARLQRDQTVDILLADDELTPKRLALEEGVYRFRLHNAFTSSPIQLRLEDEKSAKVQENAARAFATKGVLSETLRPGKYVLVVPQRPQWRVEIEVTAKKR